MALKLSDSNLWGQADPALAATRQPAGHGSAFAPTQQPAAPTSPPARQVGATTHVTPAGGRYERLALLGEGGMGRVERVRDCDLLREVAVKHLHPELLQKSGSLEQFLWEARVTAHLDHPNIVPVHDLGVTPDAELFFTMKLVRGATLESLISEARSSDVERFGLTRRLRLFLQLCNAVSFAHSRGVLHRDLKPSNLMVGEYGEALVTDWGLALALAGTASDGLRGAMPGGLERQSAGTPLYMSPEQAAGQTLDTRSDIYSLGVILYELVALRSPYRAANLQQLLQELKSGKVEPLTRVAPLTTTSLAAVVAKAMALQPEQRYATVTALADDVERVLEGRTPSAESASLVRRAARYYVARDPGMSKLRVVDIDQWAFSAALLGAGCAVLLARWFTPRPRIGWLLLLGALLISLPPTVRWLRLRRAARG